jgi:type I restriction enzyme S subunit
MEIKKIKVKDIVESISVTHNFKTEKLYAVNTSDVLNGDFLTPELHPVNDLKGQFKKTIKNKDILFSEIRPANRRFARVELDDTSKYVVSTKLMVLRKKNKDVNLDYFYYWLTSNGTLRNLQSRAENRIGSFPQITFDLLGEYIVPIPDDLIQNKISQVLKSIDHKIKINNKIIKELESMAKTIYDYWFLQFEFPNGEGKPYKTSGGKMVWNEELKREIPDGWKTDKIGDILFEEEKSKIQVNAAKDNGIYPFFTSGVSILSFDEYFVDGFNIFLNTGGNPDVKAYNGKCAYSTDTWCISAEDYSFVLYYYLLKFLPQFDQLFFSGSGLKHLQKDVFKNKYILLPSIKVLKSFNEFCSSIWKKHTNQLIQNLELASLRDFLLPLLMNGQVFFK